VTDVPLEGLGPVGFLRGDRCGLAGRSTDVLGVPARGVELALELLDGAACLEEEGAGVLGEGVEGEEVGRPRLAVGVGVVASAAASFDARTLPGAS